MIAESSQGAVSREAAEATVSQVLLTLGKTQAGFDQRIVRDLGLTCGQIEESALSLLHLTVSLGGHAVAEDAVATGNMSDVPPFDCSLGHVLNCFHVALQRRMMQ